MLEVEKWKDAKLTSVSCSGTTPISDAVKAFGHYFSDAKKVGSLRHKFAIDMALVAFDIVLKQKSVMKIQKRQLNKLTADLLEKQEQVIQIQAELVKSKDELLSSVKSAVQETVADSVKTGMKTYSSVNLRRLRMTHGECACSSTS